MSLPRKVQALQSIVDFPLYHRGGFSLREVDTQKIALRYVRQFVNPLRAQEWLDVVQPDLFRDIERRPLATASDHGDATATSVETIEDRMLRGEEMNAKMRAVRERSGVVGPTVSLLGYLIVSAGPAGRLGMFPQEALIVPVQISMTVLVAGRGLYTRGRVGNTC